MLSRAYIMLYISLGEHDDDRRHKVKNSICYAKLIASSLSASSMGKFRSFLSFAPSLYAAETS